MFLGFHYILECPWKTIPRNGEITVRVEFTDYLTGKTHHDGIPEIRAESYHDRGLRCRDR